MTKLSFTECPKGHALPREGCTPIYCGGTSAPQSLLPKVTALSKAAAKQGRSSSKAKRVMSKNIDGMTMRAVEELRKAPGGQNELDIIALDKEHQAKTAERVGKRLAERAVRMALLKMPQGLEGADAEEWADKKAVELLPSAMAQIEYDLLYGDDSQRREAARDVLDMTGRRRRDGGGSVTPTIILNLGGGNMLPWEKASAKVTAGTATRIEAGANAAVGDGPPRTPKADG